MRTEGMKCTESQLRMRDRDREWKNDVKIAQEALPAPAAVHCCHYRDFLRPVKYPASSSTPVRLVSIALLGWPKHIDEDIRVDIQVDGKIEHCVSAIDRKQ